FRDYINRTTAGMPVGSIYVKSLDFNLLHGIHGWGIGDLPVTGTCIFAAIHQQFVLLYGSAAHEKVRLPAVLIWMIVTCCSGGDNTRRRCRRAKRSPAIQRHALHLARINYLS